MRKGLRTQSAAVSSIAQEVDGGQVCRCSRGKVATETHSAQEEGLTYMPRVGATARRRKRAFVIAFPQHAGDDHEAGRIIVDHQETESRRERGGAVLVLNHLVVRRMGCHGCDASSARSVRAPAACCCPAAHGCGPPGPSHLPVILRLTTCGHQPQPEGHERR